MLIAVTFEHFSLTNKNTDAAATSKNSVEKGTVLFISVAISYQHWQQTCDLQLLEPDASTMSQNDI